MTKSSKKGCPADGEKIKELRNRLGKTQRQLIESIGVTLRTLARAENSENISPSNLQAIAGALGMPVEEIRRDADEVGDPHRINLRLNRLEPLKASKLIKMLQDDVSEIHVEFEIDPDEAMGEQIAETIELCEWFRSYHEKASWAWQKDSDDPDPTGELSASARIRKIGRLNSLLQKLTEGDVRLFTGTYADWNWAVEKYAHWPEGTFRKAFIHSRKFLMVGFTDHETDYLTRTVQVFGTKEMAIKKAWDHNMSNRVPPDYLAELDLPPDVLEKYKKAFNDQRDSGGSDERN
jgi:transcriptional regulator with XRE-family HTH domain